jgi:hypothetical protein
MFHCYRSWGGSLQSFDLSLRRRTDTLHLRQQVRERGLPQIQLLWGKKNWLLFLRSTLFPLSFIVVVQYLLWEFFYIHCFKCLHWNSLKQFAPLVLLLLNLLLKRLSQVELPERRVHFCEKDCRSESQHFDVFDGRKSKCVQPSEDDGCSHRGL